MADRTVAGWILERHLGSGSFGDVWRARRPDLSTPVALKVVRVSGRLRLASWRHEISRLERLDHPNIIRFHDAGRVEDGASPDMAWIATELCDHALDDDQRFRRGQLPGPDCEQLLEQMLAALAAAHWAGTVHRDVKPGNILRHADGTWKLSDFGTARLLPADRSYVETDAVGTISYMSAAAHRGRQGRSADLYALGVTLHEALTGLRLHPRPRGMSDSLYIKHILDTPPVVDRSLDRRWTTVVHALIGTERRPKADRLHQWFTESRGHEPPPGLVRFTASGRLRGPASGRLRRSSPGASGQEASEPEPRVAADRSGERRSDHLTATQPGGAGRSGAAPPDAARPGAPPSGTAWSRAEYPGAERTPTPVLADLATDRTDLQAAPVTLPDRHDPPVPVPLAVDPGDGTATSTRPLDVTLDWVHWPLVNNLVVALVAFVLWLERYQDLTPRAAPDTAASLLRYPWWLWLVTGVLTAYRLGRASHRNEAVAAAVVGTLPLPFLWPLGFHGICEIRRSRLGSPVVAAGRPTLWATAVVTTALCWLAPGRSSSVVDWAFRLWPAEIHRWYWERWPEALQHWELRATPLVWLVLLGGTALAWYGVWHSHRAGDPLSILQLTAFPTALVGAVVLIPMVVAVAVILAVAIAGLIAFSLLVTD